MTLSTLHSILPGIPSCHVLAEGCAGCTLLRASARGDLEKVKSCLEVTDDINKQMFCNHVKDSAARVAAQYGHTHICIVDAHFVE